MIIGLVSFLMLKQLVKNNKKKNSCNDYYSYYEWWKMTPFLWPFVYFNFEVEWNYSSTKFGHLFLNPYSVTNNITFTMAFLQPQGVVPHK